jgi:hypothetical protein
MLNPYKQARLDANYTQKELATELGVTPQSILMAEQALFNHPPASIDQAFPGRVAAYYEWRSQARFEHSKDWTLNYKAQKWLDFRQSISPSFKGFCVQLCFQPSLLREFENHHYSRDLLLTALSEANINRGYAEAITSRSRVLGRVNDRIVAQ